MKPLSITRAAIPPPFVPGHVGPDVVDLSGEYSHYTVPKPVADTVIHAAQTTDLGRTTSAGGRVFLNALIGKLRHTNGLAVEPDQLVVTAGATAALSLIICTLADSGEAILVPDPAWPGYCRLCSTWGVRAIRYPLLPDGRPDYDVMAELAADDVKAMIISQPSNPAGAVLNDYALKELVTYADDHDLYLVSDETCDLFRFHHGLATGPARFDRDGRVLSVFSFAKTHALAGLRIGYCVASPPLADAVCRVQEAQMTGPSNLAITAGLAALEMDPSVVDSMRMFFWQQRETVVAVLPPSLLPHPPQGGLHVLLDIGGTEFSDADTFTAALLHEQHLQVCSGKRFGETTASCVRVSLAAKEHLFGQAMERLLTFLEAHGK